MEKETLDFKCDILSLIVEFVSGNIKLHELSTKLCERVDQYNIDVSRYVCP